MISRNRTWYARASDYILLSVVGVGIYWIYVLILWLRFGVVEGNPGLRVVREFHLTTAWLEHPKSWFGLHVIVEWLLKMFGPSILPAIFLICVILLAAPREKGNRQNSPF